MCIRDRCLEFVDVTHYVEILHEYASKYGFKYGTLFLPHDGTALTLNSIAGSTRDIFQKHGFRVRVVPRPTTKNTSIERARQAMSFCRFDPDGCSDGLTALRAYSWKYDEQHQVFRKEPKHDRYSNYADAFQTFAFKFQFPGARRREMTPDRSTYTRKQHLGILSLIHI